MPERRFPLRDGLPHEKPRGETRQPTPIRLQNWLCATDEDTRSNTLSTDLAVRVAAVDNTKVWVELLGTADLANHDHLHRALSQIPLDGKDEVHVWLHRLTFCDSRALCHLDAFASEVRRRGQSITTHGASRMLRKMSAILGMDRRLNLV